MRLIIHECLLSIAECVSGLLKVSLPPWLLCNTPHTRDLLERMDVQVCITDDKLVRLFCTHHGVDRRAKRKCTVALMTPAGSDFAEISCCAHTRICARREWVLQRVPCLCDSAFHTQLAC